MTLRDVAHLVRLNKPAGTFLLFWPCAFALAFFQAPLLFYGLFFGGALVMRSAGCIINDLWDMRIDADVARTRDRPLASGKVTPFQALCVLAVFLLMGLWILLQLPFQAIVVGLATLPLVVLYPLAKRFVVWPQVVLALTFNAGVLVVATTLQQPVPWLLYAACVVWTLAYDTLYACQDTADDARLKIHSGALLFGQHVKSAVLVLYALAFLLWGSFVPWVMLLGVGWCVALGWLWSPQRPEATQRWFHANGWLGLAVMGIFCLAGS
ncbi:MAG: 4-hydroxybenzoate octaprenyltransferase [bacterium]|jgi:4-hydroxybenzoate polyprenyl transferase